MTASECVAVWLPDCRAPRLSMRRFIEHRQVEFATGTAASVGNVFANKNLTLRVTKVQQTIIHGNSALRPGFIRRSDFT